MKLSRLRILDNRVLAVIPLLLTLLPADSVAQSTFGSIRGSTQDETGAVLPQVQVTLHSVDENTDFVRTSDDSGNYLFENLKPGHYRVTVVKEALRRQ